MPNTQHLKKILGDEYSEEQLVQIMEDLYAVARMLIKTYLSNKV